MTWRGPSTRECGEWTESGPCERSTGHPGDHVSADDAPRLRTRFPLVPPAPVVPPAEVRNAAARLYALQVGGRLYSTADGEPRTPVVERYERRAALLLGP